MPRYNEPPTAKEQEEWTRDTDHAIWPDDPKASPEALIAWNLACLVDSIDTLTHQIAQRNASDAGL